MTKLGQKEESERLLAAELERDRMRAKSEKTTTTQARTGGHKTKTQKKEQEGRRQREMDKKIKGRAKKAEKSNGEKGVVGKKFAEKKEITSFESLRRVEQLPYAEERGISIEVFG